MPESTDHDKPERPRQTARSRGWSRTPSRAASSSPWAAAPPPSPPSSPPAAEQLAPRRPPRPPPPPLPRSETAQFGKGDVGILNYALTLEYLETAFYQDVIKSGLFKGAEAETIKKFGAEEAEHVAALTAFVKKLGGKPAEKPKTEFPLKSAKSVLELAATVENLGAAAYLGQAPNIQVPRSSPRRSRSTASRADTPRPSTRCSVNRSPQTGPSP